MATSQMTKMIEYIRKIVLAGGEAELTDGQLLECFVSHRDEAAVAALVRRHGPMVWGVCRRVLRSHQDAEDAFQATFLVLLRKAASIRSRELVGNWLYGVAHQTALKARAMTAKRMGREKQVNEMSEPEARTESDLWADLQPLLDQELSRLPDKYRLAIVLCDLEGKPRKETARQLKIPEGTLSSRLTTARTLLAKRLSRHGLALSGGSLAVAISQNTASALVPTSVMSSTIKAVTLGEAAATGLISVKVVALTEGVVKSMLLTKLKTMTALLLMLVSMGAFTTAMLAWGQTGDKGNSGEKSEAMVDAKETTQAQQPIEGEKPLDTTQRPQFRAAITVNFDKKKLQNIGLQVQDAASVIEFINKPGIRFKLAELQNTVITVLNGNKYLLKDVATIDVDFENKAAQAQPKDPPKEFTNSVGMKFVWIPPGTFMMGSPKEEKERSDGETQHKVTLTKGFYMGVYTVTQEQWQEVMGNNPSTFKGEKNLPVETVSWNHCQEFVKKLREKDKKLYRLPSEAEWEYSCRAGTTTPFHFGETISTDQANYNGNFTYGNGKKGRCRNKTTSVGSFPANAFGLHDMHGNVLQWCQDSEDEGDSRVLRGGSFSYAPRLCRSATRIVVDPSGRNNNIGFRVCFSIDMVPGSVR